MKLYKAVIYLILILVSASCANDEHAPIIPGSANVSGTLPVMYIDTEHNRPITSKTEYINASYRIEGSADDNFEAIGSATNPEPMQIRGRGHSSWKGNKKPYKIKLETSTGLLGMAANKHWALLKPSESSIAGFQLGKLLGMDRTPSIRPVEVVLNGDYIGLYFLTETIRIGKNRVDIYKQEDGETNTDLISGGWLVEIDNYTDESQIVVPENGSWLMNIRYHSPKNLSPIQSTWLKTEFKAINSAIYSNTTDWERYIDVESMARFFILQEVMDNPDGFHGSFYLHKDLGEGCKWVAGPAWDLSCYFRKKTDYTFRLPVHYQITPHWIGKLIEYGDFCRSVNEVWSEVYPGRLNEIYNYIDETISPLEAAWANDCTRWGEDPTQSAGVRAERIKKYLRSNMEWLDRNLPKGKK